MVQSTTTPSDSYAGDKLQQLSSEFSAECSEVREDFQELMDNVGTSVADYCRKRPLVAGLTVFAVGFYMGWKIKPW